MESVASAQLVRSVASDKQSAVALVAAEVRRAILTGQLAPGQSFAVTDLTSQLGVSHIPVREALRQLEAQGLVVLSAARRPMVAILDLDDLDAIYDVRLRLEPPIFARSVPLATEEWLEQLERHLHVAFDATASTERQWENHYLLHRALVGPAISAWELRIMQQLWDAAERYKNLVYNPQDIDMRGPAERDQRTEKHRQLVDIVRSGDADGAAEALHAHLAFSLSVIRELVAKALAV